MQNAGSVLIGLGKGEDVDTVSAALALYLALGKAGKQVSIVSSYETKVELSFLFGIDKITNQISGSNNLVVSFPYQEGNIERVSYNIAGNRFNLVIEPRGNNFSFDPKQIQYHHGPFSYDLIFVLAAEELQALGDVYRQQEDLFSQKPIINIDKSNNNRRFGRINLVSVFPLSQTIAVLLKALNLPLDQDVASNLLTGISSFGADLSLEKTKPELLEAAAFLLRSGGRILKSDMRRSEPKKPTETKFSQPLPIDKSKKFFKYKDEEKKAPEDWLKPKIFTTQEETTLL